MDSRDPNRIAVDAGRARSLQSEVASMLVQGRYLRAAAVQQEVEVLLRGLAVATPTSYREHHADSLRMLGVCLAEAGRKEEAAARFAEAIDLHRALAADGRPETLQQLVFCLKTREENLDIASDERFASHDERIGIMRTLAQTDPQAHLPSLADTLRSVADSRIRSGGQASGLLLHREALEIERHLAASSDGKHRDFAARLRTHALLLLALGRLEGLSAASEAIRLEWQLAEGHCWIFADRMRAFVNAAAGAAWSRSLFLALVISALRAPSSAPPARDIFDSIRSARAKRADATSRPTAEDRADIERVASLVREAEAASVAKQYETARTLLEKVAQSYRHVGPGVDGLHLTCLADVLERLCRLLLDTGNASKALAVQREAVEVRRALLDTDPRQALVNLGNTLRAFSSIPGAPYREAAAALAEAEDAIGLAYASHPQDEGDKAMATQWEKAMVALWEERSSWEMARGHRRKALQYGRMALKMHHKLLEAHGSRWLPRVAACLRSLAAKMLVVGHPEAILVVAELVDVQWQDARFSRPGVSIDVAQQEAPIDLSAGLGEHTPLSVTRSWRFLDGFWRLVSKDIPQAVGDHLRLGKLRYCAARKWRAVG